MMKLYLGLLALTLTLTLSLSQAQTLHLYLIIIMKESHSLLYSTITPGAYELTDIAELIKRRN